MNRTRFLFGLFAVTILALLWVAFLWRKPSNARREEARNTSPVGAPREAQKARPAYSSILRTGSSGEIREPQLHRMEFTDDNGISVEGVRVTIEPCLVGALEETDCEVIGTSSKSGYLEIHCKKLAIEGAERCLVARHPDYVPLIVPAAKEAGLQRIVLDRAVSVRIDFSYPDGKPVQGGRFAISSATLPRIELEDSLLGKLSSIGGITFSYAESQASGAANVQCLAAGRYYFQIEHRLSFLETNLSDSEMQSGAIDIQAGQQRQIKCIVHPLMAAVFEIAGDEIMNCARSHKREALESGFVAESSVGRATLALKKMFPGATVGVRVMIGSSNPSPTEKWTIDLERTGEHIVDVPLQMAAKVTAPIRYDFSSKEAGASEVATVKVSVVDSMSKELTGVPITLMPKRKLHHLRQLTSGETTVLRPGEYRIMLQEPWLKDRIKVEPLIVSASENREVRLQILEPACELIIETRRSDNYPLGYASASFECDSGYRAPFYVIADKKPLRTWLPVGAVSVSLSSAGFPDKLFRAVLRAEDDSQILRVTL